MFRARFEKTRLPSSNTFFSPESSAELNIFFSVRDPAAYHDMVKLCAGIEMSHYPPARAMAAFGEGLNARFRGPLMKFFLRRSRTQAAAEDLTQEVLLRALSATNIDPAVAPDKYIFKIAANLLSDERRVAQRNVGVTFVSLDQVQSGELARELIEEFSPERVLLGREALATAFRTLGELGERTRDIYILFRLEGMRQKDIAALYGITPSAVEKQVIKAAVHLMRNHGRK